MCRILQDYIRSAYHAIRLWALVRLQLIKHAYACLTALLTKQQKIGAFLAP
jgi:hypothetical protein